MCADNNDDIEIILVEKLWEFVKLIFPGVVFSVLIIMFIIVVYNCRNIN